MITRKESEERAKTIIEEYEKGVSFNTLAERYGISRSMAYGIYKRFKYKEVTSCSGRGSIDKVKFKGIRDFLEEKHIARWDFIREMSGTDNAKSYRLNNLLVMPTWKKLLDIYEITQATGMTFEELFGEELAEMYQRQRVSGDSKEEEEEEGDAEE